MVVRFLYRCVPVCVCLGCGRVLLTAFYLSNDFMLLLYGMVGSFVSTIPISIQDLRDPLLESLKPRSICILKASCGSCLISIGSLMTLIVTSTTLMSFPLAFTRRSIVLKSWKPQSIYILKRLSREVVEISIGSFMIVMVTSTTLIYISSSFSLLSIFFFFYIFSFSSF